MLLLAIKYAHWRRWSEYYPTLLYISVCNLFYNYTVKSHHLWKFKSPFVPHEVMDIIYTFIINPSMTIIFLSYHPRGWRRISLYWLAWIVVFSAMESIQYVTGAILYFKGWNIPWTVFFYTLTFPMLYLHYRKPLAALLLSVPITIGFMWIFDYLPF
jgi:hypothetical protein